jgi:hypothetical protein
MNVRSKLSHWIGKHSVFVMLVKSPEASPKNFNFHNVSDDLDVMLGGFNERSCIICIQEGHK